MSVIVLETEVAAPETTSATAWLAEEAKVSPSTLESEIVLFSEATVLEFLTISNEAEDMSDTVFAMSALVTVWLAEEYDSEAR